MISGVIAVLLIIFFITEKKETVDTHADRPKLTLKHFDWRFKFFVAIAGLFAIGNSSDVFLILRAQQKDIQTVMIPVVYLVFNLVYSLSAIPAGIVADRFGRKRIILLGFVLFATLYYGFAVASSTRVVWILFGLFVAFMLLIRKNDSKMIEGRKRHGKNQPSNGERDFRFKGQPGAPYRLNNLGDLQKHGR